jgi:hypothetical protein
VSLREHKNTVGAVAVGAMALTVHLGAGAAIVEAATRWAGWIAVGVALTGFVLLHVAGFRSLASRRNRQPQTDRDRRQPDGHGARATDRQTVAGQPRR